MRSKLYKIAQNPILKILIIGAIGVQTITSCSSDDSGGGGNNNNDGGDKKEDCRLVYPVVNFIRLKGNEREIVETTQGYYCSDRPSNVICFPLPNGEKNCTDVDCVPGQSYSYSRPIEPYTSEQKGHMLVEFPARDNCDF